MDSFSILLIVVGAVIVAHIIADCIVRAVKSGYAAREASWKAYEAKQQAKAEKWKYRQLEFADEAATDSSGTSEPSDVATASS